MADDPEGSDGDGSVVCDCCGESVIGGPWILLKRYSIGTGEARRMTEMLDEDGDYCWDLDAGVSTGALLHWPGCVLPWVDAGMIETDYEARSLPPGAD